MKKSLLALFIVASAISGYAQCTPGAPTGTPGLSPAPANVPCIERGVFYDFTLQFENFTGFSCSGFGVNITSATIDNMSNFPCGITWQANKTSYAAGEAGCVRISGTTNDSVGQYPLTVEMTFVLDIFGSPYTVSGTIGDLQQQLSTFGCSAPAVNANYFSRVIDPGNTCPAIGGSPNQTSSGPTCSVSGPGVTISGGAAVCAGSPAMLTANATNATGAITYLWSPGGDTTQSITVNPVSNTTYSVTITAGNGTATGSATVTVNQQPNAAFTASVSGSSATVNNTSTAGTSYAWNFGDGQSSTTQHPAAHNYTNSGTYTITLIVTNSCGSDTATQQVTIGGGSTPSVTISGNTGICGGDSTTLTANVSNATGTVSYLWNTGDTAQSVTINPVNSTTYSVTVTAQNGTATASSAVTINQQPDAAFTATPSGTTVAVTNTTTGATSYSWNFGDGQTSATQNPAPHTYAGNGIFIITLIATNNCGSDTTTQQVTVSGGSGPSVTISGNTTVCEGYFSTLTASVTNATGPVTYAWGPVSDSDSTITISPITTTVYTVTVTAQNGVASSTATVRVIALPSAAFTANLSLATVSVENTTTGATSFEWDFGDGEVSALQDPGTHTYATNGTYAITLVATGACGSDTARQTVSVIVIGIEEADVSQAELKVFPNPFNTSATVEVNGFSDPYHVILYSITGVKIHEMRGMSGRSFLLQKDFLPQGVYFLEIINEHKTLAREKIVIY